MQRNGNMVGMPIGVRRGSGFEESEKRIRLQRLDLAHAVVGMLPDSPWFALRCWTGREEAVDNILGKMGISSLVPMRKGPDMRRRGRLIEGRLMPVIHGYVLVQMVPDPLFLDAMKGVDHVIEVLGGCLNPRAMSGAEVSRFKRLADEGAYDWEKPCEIVVRVGDKVVLNGEPFTGMRGIVETPNEKMHGDVVVSVSMMGRMVPVNVPLALLEKL